MADGPQSKRKKPPWTVTSVAVAGCFHMTAILLVFVAVVAISMPLGAAWGTVAFAWDTEVIRGAVQQGLLVQLGISIAVWGLVYGMYRAGRGRLKHQRAPRVVGPSRGTVVTETLIAMPVLLLLIFGMMQLAINNMAGILHQVASFQAARTVWVWEQEPDIDDDELKDRVRISVAQTMTPVAPGRFPPAHDQDLSDRAERTQSFMAARFSGWGSWEGALMDLFGAPDLTIPTGLDAEQSEHQRALSKFEHAYLSMDPDDITIIRNEEQGQTGTVGAQLRYYHFQSMPLVGRIFGVDKGGWGSSNAYYQRHEMEFELPRQMYGVGRP